MDRRPVSFLNVAATFCLLAGSQLLLAVLLLDGVSRYAVAPPIDPWDDAPWLRLTTPAVDWKELEAAEGATVEAVVTRLGPPIRVRRDTWRLPGNCAQVYVYAAILEGRREAIGLCITDTGRVHGSSGPGIQFDLRLDGCGGMPPVLVAQVLAAILACPVAATIAARRRLVPLRLPTIR